MNRAQIRKISVALGIVSWLLAIVVGFALLLRYQFSAGQAAEAHAQWPGSSKVPLAQGRPTLIVVAHPKCPCSSATLDELARLMANCDGKVEAYVLFMLPQGERASGEEWHDTALRRQAEGITGVTAIDDPDGVEGQRFGVFTSGNALLYDPNGRLLFAGGLTGSRGHSGDNFGREAIEGWILKNQGAKESPVYGCPMHSGEETCQTKP